MWSFSFWFYCCQAWETFKGPLQNIFHHCLKVLETNLCNLCAIFLLSSEITFTKYLVLFVLIFSNFHWIFLPIHLNFSLKWRYLNLKSEKSSPLPNHVAYSEIHILRACPNYGGHVGRCFNVLNKLRSNVWKMMLSAAYLNDSCYICIVWVPQDFWLKLSIEYLTANSAVSSL